MKYNITTKNVKQSISNLSQYLKDKGFHISHNVMLDGFAKSLFLHNWNTLSAVAQKPTEIKDIELEYKYILEIDIALSQSTLRLIMVEAFQEAKAPFNIDSFIKIDNGKEHSSKYQIVLNLLKGSDNILTGFILLAEKFKSIPVIPESMEFCRVQVEKESFMEYFNSKN